MGGSLRDVLDGVLFPVTVLANRYGDDVGGMGDVVLSGCAAGYCGDSSLPRLTFCVVDLLDGGGWSDDLLGRVSEGDGILVLNVGAGGYRIGKLFSPEEVVRLRASRNVGAMLYAWCMMAGDMAEPLKEVAVDVADGGAGLVVSDAVLGEIDFLGDEHCLYASESLALYLFKGSEAPAVMDLIGRARAVTFAAIGAGSGKEVDVSDEDGYYDHLLLWDKRAGGFVGAYRLGFTREIIETYGEEGVYLDGVFDFKREFYERMAEGGNAMELSRSFILPCYQRNPQMLDALWKGIGLAAVARDCFTLFGSVTISASFTPLSQAIMVDTLDRFYGECEELRECVSAKVPFVAETKYHGLVADAWSGMGLNKLNGVIEELEAGERSIPPLIRYYVALGARFMSFQVEESFNDAIYCLLRVDLKAMPRRYKKRFLNGEF